MNGFTGEHEGEVFEDGVLVGLTAEGHAQLAKKQERFWTSGRARAAHERLSALLDR